jgi:propanol-preferring alcohol dehydrogenase
MSDIPAFPYSSIYGERSIVSVANKHTRRRPGVLGRGRRAVGVRTQIELFPFSALAEALGALERGVRGAAVVRMQEG